jgi:murein DD-endopeptidase MepM/ murein hydrolase activator NlpD
MPRRAPAQRRPARRSQRRNEHRLRRFALLTVIAAVLVGSLLLTAFNNSTPTARESFVAPAPAQRLLPAGRPEPLVIAKLGSLRLDLPITATRVTAIGFHGAGEGALALAPVGRQGNEGLVARLGRKLFGTAGAGPVWYQLGGGGGPQTSGLDVGATPGTEVYSPVDGRIVGLTPFVLSGRPYGVRIDIQPANAPSVVVSLTHLDSFGALSVGSTVSASTTRLGTVLDLSGVERQSLAQHTNDAGNHVAIEVRPAAMLSLN